MDHYRTQSLHVDTFAPVAAAHKLSTKNIIACWRCSCGSWWIQFKDAVTNFHFEREQRGDWLTGLDVPYTSEYASELEYVAGQ